MAFKEHEHNSASVITNNNTTVNSSVGTIYDEYSIPLSKPTYPTNAFSVCNYEVAVFEPTSSVIGINAHKVNLTEEGNYDVLNIATFNKPKLVERQVSQVHFDDLQVDNLKNRSIKDGEYHKMSYRKGKPVISWIFKVITVLLLIAVIGMGYFCYHLNKELVNNKKTVTRMQESVVGLSIVSHLNESVSDLLKKGEEKDEKESTLFRRVEILANHVNKSISELQKKEKEKEEKEETRIKSVEILANHVNKSIFELQKKVEEKEEKEETRIKRVEILANYVSTAIQGNLSRMSSEIQGILSREKLINFPNPRHGIDDDGRNYTSGVVKIWFSNKWHYIWSWLGYFKDNDAKVVCKTGGFVGGTYDNGKYNALKGSISGNKWKVTLNCTGIEISVFHCPFKDVDYYGNDIIGVKCF